MGNDFEAPYPLTTQIDRLAKRAVTRIRHRAATAEATPVQRCVAALLFRMMSAIMSGRWSITTGVQPPGQADIVPLQRNDRYGRNTRLREHAD